MKTYVPMPLERHPWYTGRDWVTDWVEGQGLYANLHTLRIPVMPQMRISYTSDDLNVCSSPIKEVVLTRRRCAGPAPWTGRPYHYEWYVGTDQYDRHVAGDARIVWDSSW